MLEQVNLFNMGKNFVIWGLAFIIVGLLIIVSWQRGFVKLQPLQCPEREIPFAFELTQNQT